MLVLLNFLRDKGAKITLVGDPDQCIYEFSMADATSLPNLKKKWALPEKPLSQSFRCNNTIASTVRNVGGNPSFTGCGDGVNEWHGAFIVREGSQTFVEAVSALQVLTARASVDIASSAIICRAHEQLESIRGKVNFANLKGKTRDVATASFLRDSRHDYRGAFQIIFRLVRELTGDDPLWQEFDETPESARSIAAAKSMWQFVKDPERLPSVSQLGSSWICRVREQLAALIAEMGVACNVKLGHHIKKTGLTAGQMALPLFEAQVNFPAVRQDTIHQVKGESIDAVLVIGSTRFWNSVVQAVRDGTNSEDRRLAYVAMTRARHLLLVALPKGHFDNHSSTWENWGFKIAQKPN